MESYRGPKRAKRVARGGPVGVDFDVVWRWAGDQRNLLTSMCLNAMAATHGTAPNLPVPHLPCEVSGSEVVARSSTEGDNRPTLR